MAITNSFINLLRFRKSGTLFGKLKEEMVLWLTLKMISNTEVVNYFTNFMTLKPDDYKGISTEKVKEILKYECAEDDTRLLM